MAKQKGWLDKYGEEINANKGSSSASKEWMGEGYSNVGRDYSPAWGGQFKDGGEIPQAQKGKVIPPRVYTDYNAYTEAMKLYADSADLFNANKLLTAPLLNKKFKVDTNPWNNFSDKIKDKKTGKKVKVSDLNNGKYKILDKSKVYSPNPNIKPTSYIQLVRKGEDRPMFGDEYGSMFSTGDDYWYAPQYDQPQPITFEPKKQQPKTQSKPKTPQKPKPGGWKPLTKEVAKGHYSGDISGMVYRETGDPDNPYNITVGSKPKLKTPPEPTLKPRPFVPATKLPMGEPTEGMQIQQRTFPKLDVPNVNVSGPYMVGYTDYDTQQGVDRGFATAEERDAFYKQLSERQAGNYQPSQGNITSYYDVNRKLAMGGSLPGSVGFTYARTNSPAPSEGPYAKKTLPSAQNGEEMSYYQNGLDWKPKSISRDGSVIKDNNGYWNPDNWGKVVEIDSPDITMQGVNQPLVGISDEGDVQYMEPGKNYKFKGKKVKEYPVGKNGVNQQDEKVIEQLDQLTNFTNYNKPTKGGWLDKYN